MKKFSSEKKNCAIRKKTLRFIHFWRSCFQILFIAIFPNQMRKLPKYFQVGSNKIATTKKIDPQ